MSGAYMYKGKEHRVSQAVVSPPALLGGAEGKVKEGASRLRGHRGKAKNILKKKHIQDEHNREYFMWFWKIRSEAALGQVRDTPSLPTALHVPTEISQGKAGMSQPQPAFHQHCCPCTMHEPWA